MSLSGLLRAPKGIILPIKKEHNTTVDVKQEFSVGFFKNEPKVEVGCQPSFMKLYHQNGLLLPNVKKCVSQRNLKKRPKEKYKHINSTRINQFARAVRVHRTLIGKDSDTLSGRQLESLTWAEKVIVRENLKRNDRFPFNRFEIPNESPIVRDSPILIEAPIVHESPVLIEDDKISNTLQLAVVDFGTPGGRYSFSHGSLIEKAFGKEVVKHTLKNFKYSVLSYGSPSWNDGVIVLDCKNQLSYDFAKITVARMKLWQGSVLKATPPENNPFMSKATLDVPDLGIMINEMLDVLRVQNPLLNMKTWKIIEEDLTRTSFIRYTILVSEPPAALLQNRQLKLFFGAGEVTLKLLGCNWTDEL